MKRKHYILATILIALILNVVPYSLAWDQGSGLSIGPSIRGPGGDEVGDEVPCDAAMGRIASKNYNGWPFQTYWHEVTCSPWRLNVGSIIGNSVIAGGLVGVIGGIMKITRRREN